MKNITTPATLKIFGTMLACVLALILFGCDSGTTPASTPITSGPTPASTPITSGPTPAGFIQIDPDAQIRSDTTAIDVGQPVPDFSLPGTDGKTYSMSGLKGKVVFMEFMATWCPHCQADAPEFNTLYDTYGPRGVQFLSINATPRGHDNTSPATTNDLIWFRDTYSVKYPLLFDKSLKSSADYGILGYPTIYIVDQKGIVAYHPADNHLPTTKEMTTTMDDLLK